MHHRRVKIASITIISRHMEDINKKCVDCGEEFVYTVNDQQFYSTKVDAKTGESFLPPKRCRSCRIAKKQRYENKTHKSQGY